MPLPTFAELERRADSRSRPRPVIVAGGADATVIEAMSRAIIRGWVRPVLFAEPGEVESVAADGGLDLSGMEVRTTPTELVGRAAVEAVRTTPGAILLKGRIATPALMHVVLDRESGLRGGHAISQVVLMEIPRDGRVFLLADTGIVVRPTVEQKLEILGHLITTAQALGLERPRVAVMAASEKPTDAMPETLHAAEFALRNAAGELFAEAIIEGPLSFDLAYSVEAGGRKGVAGAAVGAADAMLFPDLASANLTVKAIMYTADCRFGGVLRGTTRPVAFMSRADSVETRVRSLALACAVAEAEAEAEADESASG